jgi:hypothetical protein
MFTRRTRSVAAWSLLAVMLIIGELLRLWGVRHGLPYVYNLDEGSHFVKLAVRYFGEGYNPRYFQNPPGFSYLLHVIFAFGYGGIWPRGAGVEVKNVFATDPTHLYVIGRVVAGLMGVAAAAALFVVGRRMYGTITALVAAALMLFTFLPVHYGHLALNDVPTLLPLVIGLYGVAIIYERGSWLGYLVAGAGLGVSIGFKYTAAALVVPIVLATVLRVLQDRSRLKPELIKLVAAGGITIVGFLIVNPYAIITPHDFLYYVRRQQHYSSGVPKLGLDDETGWQYYVWTLFWGYGIVPLALSAIGAVLALRRDWRKASLLLSFIVVYWLFMGVQERFYARWFLPVYPFVAIFAGYAVARIAWLVAPRWRYALGAAIVVVALIQPMVHVVHNDRVLTRTDTRELARNWLLDNLPEGQRMVLERIASPGFARVSEDRTAKHIWRTYAPKNARVEEYVNTLKPKLLDTYARQGFCIVVTGSILRDRAFKDPSKAPKAIKYYAALDRDADLVAEFSPMKKGHKLPSFNYDLSYDYYPLGYERPGPLVQIYRLRNGFCKDQPILKGDPGTAKPLPQVSESQVDNGAAP